MIFLQLKALVLLARLFFFPGRKVGFSPHVITRESSPSCQDDIAAFLSPFDASVPFHAPPALSWLHVKPLLNIPAPGNIIVRLSL